MPEVRIHSALSVEELATRLSRRLGAPAPEGGQRWNGSVIGTSFFIRAAGWSFGVVRGMLRPAAPGCEIVLAPPRPPLGTLVVLAVVSYLMLPRADWRAHLPSLASLFVVVALLLFFQDRQFRAQWERTRAFLEEIAR